MSPEAEAVILIFNQLVPLVVGKGRRALLLMNGENIRAAEDLFRWIEARGYTIGAYLASCFAKHSWAYRPDVGRVMRPEYEAFFRNNRDDAYLWWGAVVREAQANQAVELSPGHEIVKKRLLAQGGPKRCMAQPNFTGGYNRLSRLCQRCPARTECQ